MKALTDYAIELKVDAVRTRSSTQEAVVSFAIPLERAELIAKFMGLIDQTVAAAFTVPGGHPSPQEESQPPDLNVAVIAAFELCRDEEFWQFMEQYGREDGDLLSIESEEDCAHVLKDLLEIKSRRHIAADPDVAQAFAELRTEYQRWGV